MTLQQVLTILKKNNSKGPATFRSNLRAVIRGLWSGIFDIGRALDSFDIALRSNLTRAWSEGAIECGIAMNELTQAERSTLEQQIRNQSSFAFNFLLDVEEKNKDNGFPLAIHFRRIEKWVNQYPSVQMLANSMACADAKKLWVLGDADHCNSCKKLAGKVKRNSFWLSKDILPRNAPNDKLICGGYECDCRLKTTDLPLSKGPLPRVP